MGAHHLVVQVLGIRLLDVGGIRQEVFAGIGRGTGCENAPAEPFPGQQGNSSGVIDVGMGEHHIRDGAAVERQMAVFLVALLAPPLEHAEVQ